MSSWLSETWGANWRPFQYFNFYRLVVATMLVVATTFSPAWLSPLHGTYPAYFSALAVLYVTALSCGMVFSLRWKRRFNLQLSLQMMADVATVALLMHGAGGVSSGLGVLLLVSLAAASLVGRGRLVLFYAALATLAVLITQFYGVLALKYETSTIVQAGMLSGGFFATAILARLLGQRVMANEELARRRGEALDNQIRISQRVIERMQDGVLVVSPDGRVQRHNPKSESLLGVQPADGARLIDYGRSLGQAYGQWLGAGGSGVLDFAGAGGKELRARFERTNSSDGEALVFLEDLGRIRDRAQELKLAALGRLTANIAHEIRNPLASISHAGDLLYEERRGEVHDRLLRILRDNVGRLDRIVRDVLELGRRDRVVTESIDLSEFLVQFVDEYMLTAGRPRQTVVIEGQTEQALSFDRSHLQQVLGNLLGNALRHCRGGIASVRLQVSGSGEGRVELHVRDDGEGVPDELVPQVFEPFFTTHHTGTGLGLFIARELCEANGASLSLVAGPSGGHFVLHARSESCQ